MATDNSENWFLKKHESGEIFGPVSLEKIREWARSAQVNSQDMLSNDNIIWTQAPMIPQMEMDWLVEVNENLLYGPTTAETLLEFLQLGEITAQTMIINCRIGESMRMEKAGFYPATERKTDERKTSAASLTNLLQKSGRGNTQVNLQSRVRELEAALLDKRRKLMMVEQTVVRLETKVKALEGQLRKTGQPKIY